MLISDDCLSFLKMQIDHYRENNQCLSDAGREKYGPFKERVGIIVGRDESGICCF